MCHYIQNTDIRIEIESFIIKNNPGARMITRRSPILPEDDLSISPAAILSLYHQWDFHFHLS